MTKQTNAEIAYTTRLKQTHLLLEAIINGIELHEQDQNRDPRSWGHAGDLARVNEELTRIAIFLGVEPLE